MLRQWLKLTTGLPGSPAQKTRHGERLLARYGARGRHYHNAAHVKAMLRLCQRYEKEIAQPDLVRFAIWFHDAVYVSRRNDNEERSAEYGDVILAALQAPHRHEVGQLILATKRHHLDALPRSLQADGAWFLDFDLAILASAPSAYQRYSTAIRREYAWVSPAAYQRGRSQVLTGFLARPRLYFTAPLQEQWEGRARRNLTNELGQLAAG